MNRIILLLLFVLINFSNSVFAAVQDSKVVVDVSKQYLNLEATDNLDPKQIANSILQDATPLDIKESIFLALRYNPDVQNSELGRIVDKFNLRQAQNEFELQWALNGTAAVGYTRTAGESASSRSTTLTPATSLNGIYGTNYSLTMNNPTDSSGIYNPGINLQIIQPLLRGFGKDVTLASLMDAEDQELISRLSFKRSLISVVTNVINNYRSLIQQQNNIKTAQLSLENYQMTIKNDKALIRAGRKAPTEVLSAEADYASEKLNYQRTINSVITARYTLLDSIGLPPETKIKVPSDVDVKNPIVPDREAALEIALKNNIQYQSDLLGINITRRALMIAEDNARPLLNLTIDASTGNGTGTRPNSGLRSLSNNKNTNVGASLALNVPIDDYALKGAIINAKVALSNAKINLIAQRRRLKTTIFNNITDVESNMKEISLSRTALELKEKDQEILNAKLRAGLVSTFEVTTRQQELNTARREYINAKITYLNSLTTLFENMGITLEKWDIDVIY